MFRLHFVVALYVRIMYSLAQHAWHVFRLIFLARFRKIVLSCRLTTVFIAIQFLHHVLTRAL